jgi:DNA-binding HxlR family transcriptional regulator
MPQFTHNGKIFNNPVEFALEKIGGKWKMPILYRLKNDVRRYSELKKGLLKVTHKMLSQQLRELEADDFIARKVYPVVPPKVEYSLTEKGKKTINAIESLRRLGLELMKIEKVPVTSKSD